MEFCIYPDSTAELHEQRGCAVRCGRMSGMRPCFRTLRIATCVVAALISGCKQGPTVAASSASSAERGKITIETYGCGKCHTIPGIRGANGVVGPPLESVARRTYIGGNFPNTPDTLTHWILAPQMMKPKTAMPSLNLSEPQARDVAAYLETLR
jgi:cytochrome c2